MTKSWREKREKEMEPTVVKIEGKMRERFGPGRMVIATPKIIDGLVRKVPKSKLTSVNQIMDKLCEVYNTDVVCPMTTGIFLGIVAKAAEEDRTAGKIRIAPYWRVLKTKGALNPRFPGGMETQAEMLEAEGHRIDKTRKTWKVEDYEKKMVKDI